MAELTYKRAGLSTHIYVDGNYIGTVARIQGSDSSPRGRAYRIFHIPIAPNGHKLSRCYTRAEAVDSLIQWSEIEGN